MKQNLNIALVGNPNSGKTSLFNALTGLNQKVGNFPGVTVDKKTGSFELYPGQKANIIDLPGTYSLYPKRADEWVAYKVLIGQDDSIKPDMIVVVADASNLKRNLLFCTQIIDLKIPVVIAFSMMDLAAKGGTIIDLPEMERLLGVPIVSINPRKNKGIPELKKTIASLASNLDGAQARDFIDANALAPEAIGDIKQFFANSYIGLHHLINSKHFSLDDSIENALDNAREKFNFNATRVQAEEIMQRYQKIKQVMQVAVVEEDPLKKTIQTDRLDNILLHRFWGYIILLAVLFILFQSVFWIAQYPMDIIDSVFSWLTDSLRSRLPDNFLSNLFTDGILAGISGIVIFIPQIMILFGMITLLEDTGYMARISFLTDKLMRKVGLNGKSVMPMISGYACAVPAIMSARNIENKKERLLTILITPLMSCSARLPVYTILIALVIPDRFYFGFLSLQGLVMMGLYMFGTLLAMCVAWILKCFIKSTERSFFILELPTYRGPRWKNVLTTMIEKAKVFVVDAGKVIMIISLLLWVLSTYGPKQKMQQVSEKYNRLELATPALKDSINRERKTALLENSYAGILGKSIEPAIKPMGFDWKIGIALITSFAAREVFVGTMATLYSVGNNADAESHTLKQKMQEAVKEDGTKVYTLATGLSLMVFYVIAMQCMSTLAIVKRETRSWKWPIIQFLYMSVLAYFFSTIIYQILK